jgi:hypothetical protein
LLNEQIIAKPLRLRTLKLEQSFGNRSLIDDFSIVAGVDSAEFQE